MSGEALTQLYKSFYRRFGGKGLGLGIWNRLHSWLWDRHLKPREVSVHGMRIFLPEGEDAVAHTLIMEGIYEPNLTRAFQEHVKPGMFVLDVGASFGYYTLLASRLVGGGGHVVALEPLWENFALLLKNLKANGCENVYPVSLAASSAAGFGAINVSAQSLVFSYREGRQPCLNASLGHILEGLPAPDAMKMDIEGSEMTALRAMEEILRSSRLRALFIECLPEALASAGFTPGQMLDYLHGFGFSTQPLDGRNLLCLRQAPGSPSA